MITFTKNLPATKTLEEGVNSLEYVSITSDDPSRTSWDFDWTLNGAPVLEWKGGNAATFNNPVPGQYDGIIQVTVTALNGTTILETAQSALMNVVTIPDEILIAGRPLSEHLRLRLLGYI